MNMNIILVGILFKLWKEFLEQLTTATYTRDMGKLFDYYINSLNK